MSVLNAADNSLILPCVRYALHSVIREDHLCLSHEEKPMAIQLKPNVTQDGNVFYVASDTGQLLYSVEMPVRVEDMNIEQAKQARVLFNVHFPQHCNVGGI